MGEMADYYDDRADTEYAYTSLGLLPITARRGGIKYPKTKGHTMPKLTPQQKLNKHLEMRALLDLEIADLQQEIKRRPSEPGKECGDGFVVDVRFSTRGKAYRFLLLRTPGGWFTTGRGSNDFFADWDDLVDWLKGPDVAWHSPMHALRADGVAMDGSKK